MNRSRLPTLLLLLCSCTGTDGAVLLDRDAGGSTADTGAPPKDAGVRTDAGSSQDGGIDTDAGPLDTGVDMDAGLADGGGDTDAGLPGVDCSQNPPVFPSFDRSCTVPSDCAIGTVQVDCCGTLTVTGIASSETRRFEEAAALCASQFPGCGCPTQPTYADDGTVATGTVAPVVGCVSGTCTTTFPRPRTPCGPNGLACDAATEVCVARQPVGPGIAYSCEPVPAGCASDRTCGCVGQTLCQGSFDVCSDSGQNQIICECPVCQ